MTMATMDPEDRRREAEALGRALPEDRPDRPPPSPRSNEDAAATQEPGHIAGAIDRVRRWLDRKAIEAEAVGGTPAPPDIEAERMLRMLDQRLSIIPPRYADVSLARDFPLVGDHTETLHRWPGQFLSGSDRGLLITGPTGTGKTRAMWAIYRAIVEANPRLLIRVRKVVELLDDFRPGEGGSRHVETIDPYVSFPLVMLDDIGAHRATEWVDERLYAVIDSRYDRKLPTVMTTNARAQNLSKPVSEGGAGIGDRLASRIAEMCDVVVMTGPDRRKS